VTSVNARSKAKITSPNACHVTSGDTRHVAPGKTFDTGSAEASDAALVNTSRASSSKATYASEVTSAKAARVSCASACLCIGGEKAAGKCRACQDHHHSSSHDIPFGTEKSRPPRAWRVRRKTNGAS
jgi:hypothetical protein